MEARSLSSWVAAVLALGGLPAAMAGVGVTGQSVWPRKACEAVEGLDPRLRPYLRTWRIPTTPDDPGIDAEGREVVLQVHVAAAGDVTWANPISGDPILARAAAEAVETWVFEPVDRIGGAPVPFITTVTVCFDASELPEARSRGVPRDLVARLGTGWQVPKAGSIEWTIALREARGEALGSRASSPEELLADFDRLIGLQAGCRSCRAETYASLRSRLGHTFGDFATINLICWKEATEQDVPAGGWLSPKPCSDCRAALERVRREPGVTSLPQYVESCAEELARCPDRESLWQILVSRLDSAAQLRGEHRDPSVRRQLEALLDREPPEGLVPRILLVLSDHIADIDPDRSVALERRALNHAALWSLPSHDWYRRIRAAEERGDFETALYLFILEGMKVHLSCGTPGADVGPSQEFLESYYRLRAGMAPQYEWIRLRGLTPDIDRIVETRLFPFEPFLDRLVEASKVVGREEELASWLLELRQRYVTPQSVSPPLDAQRIKEVLWRYVVDLESRPSSSRAWGTAPRWLE